MTIVVQRRAPAMDIVPAELQGQPVVVVAVATRGLSSREEVVRPLKAFDSPVLDLCEPKPYVAHQALLDASFRTAAGTTSGPATSPGSPTT